MRSTMIGKLIGKAVGIVLTAPTAVVSASVEAVNETARVVGASYDRLGGRFR